MKAFSSYKSCFHCRFTPFVFPGRFTSFFIRDILSPRPMNDDAPLKIISSKHQGGEIDHLTIEKSSNFVGKVFPIKGFRVNNSKQKVTTMVRSGWRVYLVLVYLMHTVYHFKDTKPNMLLCGELSQQRRPSRWKGVLRKGSIWDRMKRQCWHSTWPSLKRRWA